MNGVDAAARRSTRPTQRSSGRSRWRSAISRSARSASACRRCWCARDLNRVAHAGGARRRHRAADRRRHRRMLLAQVVLRPMHVIRSSLSRLGRGDLGATLDLRDDRSSASWATSSTRSARSCERRRPTAQAGAARRAVAPRRDARPAHRRRRARGEEPAQRDDHSSRAAQAEAGGRASRRRSTSRSSSRRSAGSTSASRAS